MSQDESKAYQSHSQFTESDTGVYNFKGTGVNELKLGHGGQNPL